MEVLFEEGQQPVLNFQKTTLSLQIMLHAVSLYLEQSPMHFARRQRVSYFEPFPLLLLKVSTF